MQGQACLAPSKDSAPVRFVTRKAALPLTIAPITKCSIADADKLSNCRWLEGVFSLVVVFGHCSLIVGLHHFYMRYLLRSNDKILVHGMKLVSDVAGAGHITFNMFDCLHPL
jgi:hypothetical protein